MRAAALALAVVLALPGCMSAELARVHRDLSRDIQGIGGGHAPAFGRVALGIARLAVGDEDEAGTILRHVRSGAVGRYDVPDDSRVALDAPRAVESARRRGWEPAVIVRSDTSAVWILARDARRGQTDLMVWSLDEEGLTLVRLTGHLEPMVRELIAGNRLPSGVDQVLGRRTEPVQ